MADHDNLLLDIEDDNVVMSRETASGDTDNDTDGSSDFV